MNPSKEEKLRLSAEKINSVYRFFTQNTTGYVLCSRLAQILVKIEDMNFSKAQEFEDFIRLQLREMLLTDHAENEDLCYYNAMVFLAEAKLLSGIKIKLYEENSIEIKTGEIKVRRSGKSFIKAMEELKQATPSDQNEFLKALVSIIDKYAKVMLEPYASLENTAKSTVKTSSASSFEEYKGQPYFEYLLYLLKNVEDFSFEVAGLVSVILIGLETGKIKKDRHLLDSVKSYLMKYINFPSTNRKLLLNIFRCETDEVLVKKFSFLILQILYKCRLYEGISLKISNLFIKEFSSDQALNIKTSKLNLSILGRFFFKDVCSIYTKNSKDINSEVLKTQVRAVLQREIQRVVDSESYLEKRRQNDECIFI